MSENRILLRLTTKQSMIIRDSDQNSHQNDTRNEIECTEREIEALAASERKRQMKKRKKQE